MHKRDYLIIVTSFVLFSFLIGCSKIVQIDEPVNTITTPEAFNSDANATSAIIGIYNNLITYGGGQGYGNSSTTLLTGLSSDELKYFDENNIVFQFQTNNILTDNYVINPNFWTPAYYDIYLANSIIEGLGASKGISTETKNQLMGEAKFMRAFSHFYLVNLFGDVPLVTTTAWKDTDTLHRTSSIKVYQQIINDLIEAQKLLIKDFSVSAGERTRANSWAATSLLARVYLYIGDWKNAEEQASSVIKNIDTYNILDDLNTVFLKNSREAILQLAVNDNQYPYSTPEGHNIIPYDSTSPPSYYLRDELLSVFELGDKRRVAWVDSTHYSDKYYYYPFKYRVYTGKQGDVSEYYMVLRLAEQYLIRAEARAQQDDISGAIADLDVLRLRAGLAHLPASLTKEQVLTAVMQERRIELFAEWGHRWFDLKRTGLIDKVLPPIKPLWKSTQKLYPIPRSETQVNPNLIQNPGYN